MRKDNIIVVSTIILCFVVTLSLCHVFSGEGFLAVFSKEEGKTVWAIAEGGYSDLTLARQSAELVKSRGGAGYVQKSGDEIEVIYAVYPSSQTANDVLEKLETKGAYVKQIDISNGKFSWCDKEKKQAVLDTLCYFDLCFDTLYNLANCLNDGSAVLQDANTQTKVLYAQIDEIKSVFYQNVQNSNEEEITQIKLALITALALLNNVEIGSSRQNAISSLRYALIQIVLCNQALMASM